MFKGQRVNGSDYWMNVLCTSDQLSYGHLLLVEDSSKLILPACILVSIPNREQQQCCVSYSQCLQVPGKKLSDLQKRASCPSSFSWLLGQSVLQRCCKSSRQVVFSFFSDLLIFTYAYMSSVFRLKQYWAKDLQKTTSFPANGTLEWVNFQWSFPWLGSKSSASCRGSGMFLWSRTALRIFVESFTLFILFQSARRSRETLLQERAISNPSSL